MFNNNRKANDNNGTDTRTAKLRTLQAGSGGIWAAVRSGNAAGVLAKLAAGATMDDADSEGTDVFTVAVGCAECQRPSAGTGMCSCCWLCSVTKVHYS